jgi:hypothetical protein
MSETTKMVVLLKTFWLLRQERDILLVSTWATYIWTVISLNKPKTIHITISPQYCSHKSVNSSYANLFKMGISKSTENGSPRMAK